ncbi:MAG: hypothetical protein IJY61_08325 [Candidatus Gastranaerophilales bacterium]|nr:hypothetical protein [Candidatus Gastranaerophilales bacterium]
MRISAINFKPYATNKPNVPQRFEDICENKQSNIPTFYGRDLVPQYSRTQTIEFLKNNPKPIAKGTDGIIYKLGNSAIKVGKTKETSFEAEAEILKQLPTSLKNSQKFIDRFNFEGKDVLVSSFVQGTHKKALNPQDFQKIFEIIFEHDKVNIIHGDLNLGNIMFSTNGEISLIDYGAATQPTSTEVELYPSFVTNTNALKFENTGVCDSLKEWEKSRIADENFSEYLKSKADFYSRHAHLVHNNEMKEYEENLSIVLKTPTKDITETELRRLKTLDLLEMADTATNYDNNPHSSIALWNETVESAKEYAEETAIKLQNETNEDRRKYFTFQHEIAKSFHSTLSDWRDGTLSWLYEIKTPNFKPRTEVEEKLQQNWNNNL